MNIGSLCTNDFKVSAGAAIVCEEVACFATPACLGELFRSMSIGQLFRSIEVNAAKVNLNTRILVWVCFFMVCSAQTLMLSRTLEGNILRGYAEIQGQVDAEHARSETLSVERSALAKRAKGLEARVAELEVECRNLKEEVWTLRSVRTILVAEIEVEW